MGFRQSEINAVLSTLDDLGLTPEEANKLKYSELQEKLVDYEIPSVSWVELWAEGSGKKPRIRNIVHTKTISKQRFCAMLKQVLFVDENL